MSFQAASSEIRCGKIGTDIDSVMIPSDRIVNFNPIIITVIH